MLQLDRSRFATLTSALVVSLGLSSTALAQSANAERLDDSAVVFTLMPSNAGAIATQQTRVVMNDLDGFDATIFRVENLAWWDAPASPRFEIYVDSSMLHNGNAHLSFHIHDRRVDTYLVSGGLQLDPNADFQQLLMQGEHVADFLVDHLDAARLQSSSLRELPNNFAPGNAPLAIAFRRVAKPNLFDDVVPESFDLYGPAVAQVGLFDLLGDVLFDKYRGETYQPTDYVPLVSAESMYNFAERHMPFCSVAENCFARAYAVCHILNDNELQSGQVFISKPHDKNDKFNFTYHVAAFVITVEKGILVIDPAAPGATGPMPLQDWYKAWGIEGPKQVDGNVFAGSTNHDMPASEPIVFFGPPWLYNNDNMDLAGWDDRNDKVRNQAICDLEVSIKAEQDPKQAEKYTGKGATEDGKIPTRKDPKSYLGDDQVKIPKDPKTRSK